MAGVRLPDQRDLVDRRLGADADHAGHLDFVETVLLGRTVPRTGEGGVEVGMTLLNHLLKRFGGDQRLALAAWYQGERAVREQGLYAETRCSSRTCSR